jgi:hypothetical protein
VFGLTKLYLTDNAGAQVAVVVVGASCALLLLYLISWCRYRGGYQTYVDHVSSKQSKDSIETMAETDANDIEENVRKSIETTPETAANDDIKVNVHKSTKSSRRCNNQSEYITI